MSTLSEVIAKAKAQSKKAQSKKTQSKKTQSKKTSGTGVYSKYYQDRKNVFIAYLAIHADPVVRIAALADPSIPVEELQEHFDVEEDYFVLRAMLLNPTLPLKSILNFKDDPRADVFTDMNDPLLEEHLNARFA